MRISDKLEDYTGTHFIMDTNYLWEGEELDTGHIRAMEEYCSSVIFEMLQNGDGAPVVSVFEKLAAEYPGFEYRVAANSKNELTG